MWLNSVPVFIRAFAVVLTVDVEQTMKPTVSLLWRAFNLGGKEKQQIIYIITLP